MISGTSPADRLILNARYLEPVCEFGVLEFGLNDADFGVSGLDDIPVSNVDSYVTLVPHAKSGYLGNRLYGAGFL